MCKFSFYNETNNGHIKKIDIFHQKFKKKKRNPCFLFYRKFFVSVYNFRHFLQVILSLTPSKLRLIDFFCRISGKRFSVLFNSGIFWILGKIEILRNIFTFLLFMLKH